MEKRHLKTKILILFIVSEILPVQAQKIEIPKFSGFINARYSWDDADDDVQGFDIRRVRISATGNLSDKVDYKFQAEYETSAKVLDAYLRWKIRPEFNLEFGECKLPYSQENLYGPTTWQTIENPAVVDQLNGYNDISGIKANGRDIGLLLYGDLFKARDGHYFIKYNAGLFNGNGINAKDDNNKKDFAGLLYFLPVSALSLTVGHYQGSYGAKGAEHVRIRTSTGAEWKDSRWTVRSEYISGNTAGQKSNGVYAFAAWKVLPIIEPVLSYDTFKPDRDAEERQTNYQVGINVFPLKNIRIQAAYTYEANKVAKDKNQVETQIFVQF
ncbi:MAG: OprO/OprP family phosphate-selective porin [Prevotella sp.]|jgi:hypothetical protein|nr:OprO/OprP family phosphate-selective porin [Prevotella sp.]